MRAARFVEPGDGTGVVSGALVDWFRENANCVGLGERGVTERLRALLVDIAAVADEKNDECKKPEDAANYWDCFKALVALGWTDAAVDLAHLHSCWDEWRMGKASAKPSAELLEAVVALLRCAPRLERVDEAELVEEEAFGDDVFPIYRTVSKSIPMMGIYIGLLSAASPCSRPAAPSDSSVAPS